MPKAVTTGSGAYDVWRNPQELDMTRIGVSARIPLDDAWRLTWTLQHYDWDGVDGPQRDYRYLVLSRPVGKSFYAYGQYR